MSQTVTATVIREACQKFPNTPTLTLARKLYKENPALWKSVDSCRSGIRFHRGNHGSSRRKTARSKEFHRPNQQPHNPCALPNPSESKEWLPFVLNCRRLGIMSDIHIPYHDLRAVTVAIDDLVQHKVDAVLLNGDIMDCYSISRWEKDPRARKFSEEIADTRKFLEYLKSKLPKAKLFWKDGNHEERYQAYMKAKAPELLDIACFEFSEVIGFANMGIEYISDKRIVNVGKLQIVHGHEWPTAVISPVNAARGAFLRAKSNALCGHWHSTSEHAEPTLKQDLIAAYSVGCLCNLHPEYARLNRWNHGHAIVDVSADGNFRVKNKKQFDGELL